MWTGVSTEKTFEFAVMFPEIKVQDGLLFMEDGLISKSPIKLFQDPPFCPLFNLHIFF